MSHQLSLFERTELADAALKADEPQQLSATQIARLLGRPAPTSEQVAVIEAPLAPLLVVAGAGSGKTETMAARVVYLVANGLVESERILGLTFTRKAASELAERVSQRLRALRRRGVNVGPGDPDAAPADPTVSTYHSYAASLVADHALRLGVEPRSRLLTEAASWQLASEVVEAWDGPMDRVEKALDTVVEAVLTLAGECAEHLVPPHLVTAYLDDVLGRAEALPRNEGEAARGQPFHATKSVLTTLAARQQVVPIVAEYTRRKRQADLMDFGDQLALAAALARDTPAVGQGERARYAAVLLDEYQDTSYAQLAMLTALFGQGHPITGVGDPHQSIYGWRGASAGNLEAFPRDFPDADGSPARVAQLSTSWRNDHRILEVANDLAGPLRAHALGQGGVDVPILSAGPGAGCGEVAAAYLETVEDEAALVAGRLAAEWQADTDRHRRDRTSKRRSMAVLCRKRSQFPIIEDALRGAGLPVEVVGLGGLLHTPEVADLLAALRVLHDPSRGDALMRLLVGPRWRLGPRDLDALGAWSLALAARRRSRELSPDPDAVEGRSIIDALDRLPPQTWVGPSGQRFSEEGHRRLSALAGELRALRSHTGLPLPDLVGEVQRAMLLDIEVGCRRGADAQANLDAFTDAAAAFSSAADSATLGAFLSWLQAAEEHERGLEPGEVEPSQEAVQLLTVHAAKGLEWDVVAVPGLVEGTFPDAGDAAGGWLVGLGVLPYELRGDRAALPDWGWRSAAHHKQLDEGRAAFRAAYGQHQQREERRLAYVAMTRARHALLLTGACWGDGAQPRRPSRFLVEAAGEPGGPADVLGWLDEPADDAANPRTAAARTQEWPVALTGPQASDGAAVAAPRGALEAAAAAVREAQRRDRGAPGLGEPALTRWSDEVDRLLAERDGSRGAPVVRLPTHLSASRLVALAADPAALALDVRRPIPAQPHPQTRRGTAFHAWLERRFGAAALVDLDELPGSADPVELAGDEQLEQLKARYLASEWAPRLPFAVEVDVETPVAGVVLRGRIDAVFRDDDGRWQVVDWKTGRPPTGRAARAAQVQLAVYRLAWSRLQGVPLEQVRAAFFYASTGQTVRPADLLDEAAVVALLESVPLPEGVSPGVERG